MTVAVSGFLRSFFVTPAALKSSFHSGGILDVYERVQPNVEQSASVARMDTMIRITYIEPFVRIESDVMSMHEVCRCTDYSLFLFVFVSE